MLSQTAYTWIARTSAFFWSFAFIQLFSYILDNIYPFWSGTISLSLFAYLLIFIVWAAYSLFFYLKPHRNKIPRIIYHVIFSINAVVFFLVLSGIGEKNYLYLYPVFFSFQLIIYFFFISSIFPALLPFRISVLAGLIPGFITYPYIGNIYIDIIMPGIVYFMPLSIFKFSRTSFSTGHQRMLPLRMSIDFLRYLFLGISFYGIFDIYRERFYVTMFILAIGPVLSYFFMIADKKKHHIKYGILLLGICFISSAFLYLYIPLNYWAAISFFTLTVWEGIYFKKIVEGDLKREQILSGIALVLGILFYAISLEWLAIISGIIVFLLQLRILIYTSKGYRKSISLLFGLGLLIWAFTIFIAYSNSYKRSFLANPKIRETLPPPSLKILNLIKDKNTVMITNLIPPTLAEDFSRQYGVKVISFDVHSFLFLSQVQKMFMNYPNAIHLYTLKNLKPYGEKNGFSYVFKMAKLNHINSLYIYDALVPDQYQNGLQTFSLNDTPDTRLLPIEAWYSFAKKLSDMYATQKKDEHSLRVMHEMEKWYDQPVIYREIMHIYGIQGDTENQIKYGQKLYDSGKSTNEDKLLLLELYFLSGDIEKASRLCEELVLSDRENIVTYLEWKYKISKYNKNRFQLEAIANTLRYMDENLSAAKKTQKNNLLKKIQADLKSNPQWEEIYKKEKTRQENIVFPD